jgi:exosortase K
MLKYTKKNISALVITGVLTILLFVIKRQYPETIVNLFSIPAAKISSLFLGIPLQRYDNLTIELNHRAATLRIIEPCSGYNFWIIFLSFFTFKVFNKFSIMKAIKHFGFLLPASYVITIIINTIRILASFYIKIFGASRIQAKYADVIHLWTGIVIFLSALILIYILFQRRIINETKSC